MENCGFARVGTDPNTIFLNHDCIKRRGPDAISYLRHVFVHEFGHAMGFKHVLAPNAVMAALGNLSDTFTAREQFHAQLAYKVGRGARYCGWPFSAECEQVNAIAGRNANTGTRSIAHAPLEHGDPLAQGAIRAPCSSGTDRTLPSSARAAALFNRRPMMHFEPRGIAAEFAAPLRAVERRRTRLIEPACRMVDALGRFTRHSLSGRACQPCQRG